MKRNERKREFGLLDLFISLSIVPCYCTYILLYTLGHTSSILLVKREKKKKKEKIDYTKEYLIPLTI